MGGATTPPYVEITSGRAGEPRNDSSRERTIRASTSGMSPSNTTAASASSGSARMPARREVFIPRTYSAFGTGVQARPRSSAWTRSLSWPTTTSTGSSRAPSAVSTARRTSVRPPTSMSILFSPMRLERPAASTTPATRSPMDSCCARAQVRGFPPSVHRQQLRDDADGHLLGSVRADVEPDGREQLRAVPIERAQDQLPARSRSEQAQIGQRLSGKGTQPVAVVRERVRLHHREVLPRDAERETRDSLGRTPQCKAQRRGKALRGQVGRPVVDDGDLESRRGGERCQRAGVVSGAEDEQTRRRAEHVD